MRVLRPLRSLDQPDSIVCVWLNGSPTAVTVSWFRLWNEAGLRWATDGAANAILDRKPDLKLPDVVSGDMDSIWPVTRERLEKRGVACEETPDQDQTDLTKALRLILPRMEGDKKIERIIVLGGLSGRFDHTMATLNSLFLLSGETQKELYAHDGCNIVCVLRKGDYRIEVDRKQLTGKCGLVPFCQEKTVVTTQGFKWEMVNQEVCFGGVISTSNEIVSDFLSVSTSSALILSIEVEEHVLSK